MNWIKLSNSVVNTEHVACILMKRDEQGNNLEAKVFFVAGSDPLSADDPKDLAILAAAMQNLACQGSVPADSHSS